MKKDNGSLCAFLNELMRLRKKLPSQLAADIGVSHTTVSRWLSGQESPSLRSCQVLAEYSGLTTAQMLYRIGYIPKSSVIKQADWPEFREYAQLKYPDELDEDIIAIIEDLIERRREKKFNKPR